MVSQCDIKPPRRIGSQTIIDHHEGGLDNEYYTATTVPTQFVEATRSLRLSALGKRSGLPLVFNQHFTGNLDNWDPAVLDGLAKEREVIIFNNAGVASSTGEVPTTFAGMAKNAEAFIDGLGLTKVDLLGSRSRNGRAADHARPSGSDSQTHPVGTARAITTQEMPGHITRRRGDLWCHV